MAERRSGVRDRNSDIEDRLSCDVCEYARTHGWWGPQMPPNQTHCHACHAFWSGQTACHCTVCHETFASYDSSDLHYVKPGGGAGRPKKGSEGKHTHPSFVPQLTQVKRADGYLYWTRRP